MRKRRDSASDSVLDTLTDKDIEMITEHAAKRRNVRLVASKQVNMRVSAETLAKAKKIAASQGKPVTTFLSSLLHEDIDRLWKVYNKVS
jgi:predicted DNA binding CopG/RHH family protein